MYTLIKVSYWMDYIYMNTAKEEYQMPIAEHAGYSEAR